jgi:hypothetical protein
MTPYAPPHLPLQAAELPLDLLGQVGQAVAQAANAAQENWPAAPAGAAAALADLEQLGLRLQEVVRVLAAPARTGLEPVDLGLAVLQARAEWTSQLRRGGLVWVGPEESVDVMANPAVLKQLLDLALGHAVGLGRRLEFRLRFFGQPAQAKLLLTAVTPGSEPFASLPGDAAEWHWVLLAALAVRAGVVAERQVQAQGVELSLTWPAASGLRRLTRQPAR